MSSAEPENLVVTSHCRHCYMTILWQNGTWVHFLSRQRQCVTLPPIGFGKEGKVAE